MLEIAALLTSVVLGPTGAVGAPVEQFSLVSSVGLQADGEPLAAAPIPAALQFLEPRALVAAGGDSSAVTARLLATPPPAVQVSSWWGALGADRQEAFAEASPRLVGNLEGVPTAVRDSANRELLADSLDSVDTVIAAGAGRALVGDAMQSRSMLQNVQEALDEGDDRTLLSLDTSGQGAASVVIGDVATADYVTYLVPGMFFTLEHQMADWTEIAQRLHDERERWMTRLGDTGTAATVAWIGYPTPNLTNIASLDNAELGRDALAASLEGLDSLRGGDESLVTVVAHSYGSTAALLALAQTEAEVDAAVLIGSPGSPVRSVDDLHVPDGRVFVGAAAWDPIPGTAFFGTDPGSSRFGAHELSVDGGTDPLTGEHLNAAVGHLAYFAEHTEAMRNMALVSLGRDDLVVAGSTAAPGHPVDDPVVTKAIARPRTAAL